MTKSTGLIAVLLPLLCLTKAKADAILLLEKPTANWEKEAFPLGNLPSKRQ